ncbi:MAG: insulinase family protein, partial [Candidatus Competibacteraceae bacterium]|nr:insulinase family protein [Candidatus Competibacteraceae bacterium]
MLETTRLTNGALVVSRSMPGFRGITLGLWLRNGVRFEPPGCNGWAALLGRLLFAGAGQLDAQDLALRLDTLGARVQVHTGRELTLLWGQAPQGALPDLLETLTDMLLTPRFDDQALARERTNLAQERDSAPPANRLEDATAALIWGNHPLGRPLTGIPKDLEGLKAPELQAYRHSLMQGRRLVVVAAGAVDHDRLLT